MIASPPSVKSIVIVWKMSTPKTTAITIMMASRGFNTGITSPLIPFLMVTRQRSGFHFAFLLICSIDFSNYYNRQTLRTQCLSCSSIIQDVIMMTMVPACSWCSNVDDASGDSNVDAIRELVPLEKWNAFSLSSHATYLLKLFARFSSSTWLMLLSSSNESAIVRRLSSQWTSIDRWWAHFSETKIL